MAVRNAFDDGVKDYHKDLAAQKKRELAGKSTPAEAASLERLKGRMG